MHLNSNDNWTGKTNLNNAAWRENEDYAASGIYTQGGIDVENADEPHHAFGGI